MDTICPQCHEMAITNTTKTEYLGITYTTTYALCNCGWEHFEEAMSYENHPGSQGGTLDFCRPHPMDCHARTKTLPGVSPQVDGKPEATSAPTPSRYHLSR